jgi:hypothetical protein
MDVQNAALVGGSALSTGAVVALMAKNLMTRLVAQYDEKHKDHASELKRIAEKFSDAMMLIHTKLAAIEVRTAEVAAMREEQRKATMDSAVLQEKVRELSKDVDAAHCKLRSIA